MSDPSEYETGSVPGYGDSENRSVKTNIKRHKPNQSDISFFPRAYQLELPLNLPRPIRSPRKGKPEPSMRVGPSFTNLICRKCRSFVSYLVASNRRCYSCRCGSVLLGARDPLNFRDPLQTEWQKLMHSWSGPISFPYSRN
jgi:hypothetical protein